VDEGFELMTKPRTALVIGGGCAGIAAAVRLAQADIAVTLLETRKRLGGRATSHLDPDTGELIDNCQHVVLGCCTNIVDLYERLDSTLAIEWHDQMYFANKAGRTWTFADDPLPAPLHLTRALLGYKGLSFRDRLNVAKAMRKVLRTRRAEQEVRTFGAFLADCRATQAAIDHFWNPIVRSACNLPVDAVSAAAAMQVFQQGFMANTVGWRMGVSSLPLALLYEHAAPVIEAAGGAVRLGEAAEQLIVDGNHVLGVTTKRGESIETDVTISTLPADRLDKITPESLREADARLSKLDQIETSPIIGMHLWLDRPILERSHVFFTDSAIDWLFVAPDQPDHGQHLHAGISAAQAWIGHTNDELLDMAMGELREHEAALPGAASVKLLRGLVIREKRATIAPVPGLEAHRPACVREGSNLLLAGDWTDTGWPSTMEGAVRSGYAAAGAALGEDLMIDDLRPGLLPRWFGRI
jgi:squalene-associated FAD-dependent desaturase